MIEPLESRTLLSVTLVSQSAAAPGAPAGIVGTNVIPRQVFIDGEASDGAAGGAENEEALGSLVPTLFTNVPSSAVGGRKVKGASAVVDITNIAPDTYNGDVTVTLFASLNATLESGTDAPISSLTRKIRIDSAQSKSLKLKIARFPSVPDGDYVIIAQVSSPTAGAGTNSNDEAIRIAAPFVDLSGTFAPVPATLTRGKRARLSLTVNNAGNVNAKGTIPVTVAVSSDPGGAGATTIATVNAKLSLKANASRTLKFNFTLPAEAPAGAQFFVVTLGSLPAPAESNVTNNTVLSATAVTLT
jgi:hypothetical protein